MRNKFKFELQQNQSFLTYIYDTMVSYGMELINTEFKDQINGQQVNFIISDKLTRFANNNIFVPGRLNKKRLSEEIKKTSDFYERSLIVTSTQWLNYQGYSKIHTIDVCIIEEEFLRLVVSCIDQMDVLIKYLKLSMRHEIGHVIDKINRVGLPIDEFIKLENEDNEFREKHSDVYGNSNSELSVRDYYALPSEARANKNVGINVDDFIDLSNQLALHGNDYRINLTIESDIKVINNKEDKNE